MIKYIIRIFLIPEYLINNMMSFFYKKRMKSCGRKVKLRPSTSVFFGLENLSIGSNVRISRYAHIYCTDAPLTIGNRVIVGPSPTIVTGNHRIDVVGKFIMDSLQKLPENDKKVIIEDDIWIGANVTILMGARISRGTVVAAGAVVNNLCPPYSITGGVPAKVIKYRFTIEEILEHEKKLYPQDMRYTHQELVLIRQKYPPKLS